MKVSLNTIKQFTDVDLSLDELKEKINAQLGAIEEVIDLGDQYKDAVIVRVMHVEKHPNADKLNVCRVDDDGAVQDIERGEDGLVQVVCGAPNVRADMWAVWLPPQSVVPASYHDVEPFVLGARELRGILSQGMLAAADELAIGTDHDGILEITKYDVHQGQTLSAGGSFAKVFGLNDVIIDIENKMFTHRPDLFGQLGVAREVAGIQHKKFVSPEWYLSTPEFMNAHGLELEVFNEATENVPRFMAVAMKNVAIKSSPLWLQCTLVAMGSKPINNIVDATNYLMLITAQPTHAYDYDKIRGHKLGARMAQKGETIKLLNDKTYELDEHDIVIADGEGPVGLAGIMGGGESEVDQNTKNIILEVASFDMYTLRKMSMRHGVFTDALTRFNKGQSPLQNATVLSHLIEMIQQLAGGVQASEVYDCKNFADQHDDIFDNRWAPATIHPDFINSRLGTKLSSNEVVTILENVEFQGHDTGELDKFSVTAPFWRTDIQEPEDIVEEVGRLHGFDKLPRELPKRSTKPAPKNSNRELTKLVRDILSRAGANEVLTYSFVHENVIIKAGQDPEEAYQIANALSPDLQYYRLSLTPSLLDKVHGNIKAGHSEFALFEIGKSHTKKAALSEDEGLPPEIRRIALSYAAKKSKNGSPYYQVKSLLDYLARKLGLSLEYKPLAQAASLTLAKPFEPMRSARVIDVTSGQTIGIIGEYTTSVKKSFKLPDYSAGFELMPEAIEYALAQKKQSYTPLSRFPSTERDICFKVATDVTYDRVVSAVLRSASNHDGMSIHFAPVDIYHAVNEPTKNITLRFTIVPREQTLSGAEIQVIIDDLAATVVETLDAEIV